MNLLFKKIFFLLPALFLFPLPSRAATDPKTAEYLTRLNQYYYYLSREGLKSFQCEVTATNTFQNLEGTQVGVEKPLGQAPYRFHLSYLGSGSVPVLSLSGSASTAAEAKLMGNVSLLAENFLKIWGLFSTDPLFQPASPQANYVVSPLTAEGFTVSGTYGPDSLLFHFDTQALARSVFMKTRTDSIEMSLEFVTTAKGPVIKRLNIDKSRSKGIQVGFEVEYDFFQGFQLPSLFTITTRTAKGIVRTALKMSGYQIHGAVAGAAQNGTDVRIIPAESELPGAKHFFWRAASASATVFILGSIHIRPDTPLVLPEVVERDFESANYVGFEFDLTQIGQIRKEIGNYIKTSALYPQGDNLLNHLTPAQWESVHALLHQYGISDSVAVRLKPSALSNLLEDMAFKKEGWDAEYGIDMIFLRKAQSAAKPVFGMEFWWEPLKAFDAVGERDQAALLLATVKQTDQSVRNVARILSMWRTGATAEMETMVSSNLSPSEKLVMDLLLKDRNIKWMGQFDRMLKTSAVYFVVVGSAHMVGSTGVPALLQSRGYRVEQF